MIGEQVFDAAGQRWTLFLGNAAQCAVEEQYDKGFFAVVAEGMPSIDPQTAMAVAQAMSEGRDMPPALAQRAMDAMKGLRLSVLRDIAWHGLVRHHAGVTVSQVSDIIDDIGQDRFGAIIGDAIRAAQGKGDGGAAPGNARPKPKPKTRAPARTGPSS